MRISFKQLKIILSEEIINDDMLNDIEQFVIGWDMGTYDTTNTEVLNMLLNKFPYEGKAYRGTLSNTIKPPLSWTVDKTSLIDYWNHVGIPDRKITAWEANVKGIDLSKVSLYLLQNKKLSNNVKMRAKRLSGFHEIITLYVPKMIKIGTLSEEMPTIRFRKQSPSDRNSNRVSFQSDDLI